MAKHKPSVIWPISKIGKYPQAYVQTKDAKTLMISFFSAPDQYDTSFAIGRREARMLARRINECLDATR